MSNIYLKCSKQRKIKIKKVSNLEPWFACMKKMQNFPMTESLLQVTRQPLNATCQHFRFPDLFRHLWDAIPDLQPPSGVGHSLV